MEKELREKVKKEFPWAVASEITVKSIIRFDDTYHYEIESNSSETIIRYYEFHEGQGIMLRHEQNLSAGTDIILAEQIIKLRKQLMEEGE
jgi:hypothetical protein